MGAYQSIDLDKIQIGDNSYVGETLDGKPHGQGTMTFPYPKCATYTGQWQHGQPHGKGVLKILNESYEHEWTNGVPSVIGTITYGPDGMVYYVGEIVKCKPHGQGTMYYLHSADKSDIFFCYSGQWVEGKKHGKIIETDFDILNEEAKRDPSKTIKEGEYINDKKHGIFTTTQLIGKRIEEYVNDKLHGKCIYTIGRETFEKHYENGIQIGKTIHINAQGEVSKIDN
jgi:hypothetical protein